MGAVGTVSPVPGNGHSRLCRNQISRLYEQWRKIYADWLDVAVTTLIRHPPLAEQKCAVHYSLW